MSWHYVSAAVIGTSHFSDGTPCLDDCLTEVILTPDDEILVAVASEGAGAGAVCESFFAAVASWLRSGGAIERLTRADAEQWIGGALCCHTGTIVAAIAGMRAAAFLQIGDGAIVLASGGSYEAIFWPDRGDSILFEVRSATFDDLAVMTDGLRRLVLRSETRTVDGSFFTPLFEPLRYDEPGYASDLEPELVAFLVSSAVNERTDDDKTLILASRGAR